MTRTVTAARLRAMLDDGDELALLDVREEGVFARGHLLFAVCLPLSRLELRLRDLVPRRSTRIVLCDGGEGLAGRAARRLAAFGYGDVAVLEGGIAAWRDAGFELFAGVNVPSKAFGEFVEHRYGTPSIAPEELKALIEAGTDMVVLDSRPMAEYRRMNIPGGIDCPGAELALRVHDIAPDPETLVVVNCAGRTRSIIGAQSLINAGIPNRVVALRNGTMGWALAGFDLETGQERRAPAASAAGLARARAAVARVAKRFGVPAIDRATLQRWRDEAETRSLFVLDVRDPAEYEAGHLPGARSAPGGQLVQATDRYVGVRGARLVLVDDDGVRAPMTAAWLIQMGWPAVAVLSGGLGEGPRETGPHVPDILGLDAVAAETVAPADLARLLEAGAASVVDVATSLEYRAGHIPGAWWAVRARLGEALGRVAGDGDLVFTSPDGVLARLAAGDAAGLGARPAKVLAGGTEAWRAAGLPLAEGFENMTGATDDLFYRAYDHDHDDDDDVAARMREYLDWETGLVEQIARDGTARFRAAPP